MKIVALIVQVIITVALLGYLSQKIDVAHVLDTIKGISRSSLILAFSLYVVQIVLAAYRLKYTLRLLGDQTSLLTTGRSVLAGAFLGQTPLSNFGGDMVRVWTIFRDGVSLRTAASAVTIDRLFGFLALVLIILCALPPLWIHATEPALRTGIVAVLGLVALGVAIFIALQKLPARARKRFTIIDWIGQVSSEFHLMLFAIKPTSAILAMAITTHFTSLLIMYILFSEVGASVTLFEVLYLAPFPLLSSLLPISIGGWGVREGAMVAAFSLIAVPATKTLSVSIMFGIISLIVALPGSLVWLHTHFSPAKPRREM